MDRTVILTIWVLALTLAAIVSSATTKTETVLSTVLTPDAKEKTIKPNEKSKLSRQGRSYYDPRHGARPLYDRLEDDRYRCGRCYDDRYDDRDRDDYDRPNRGRYDDDRRMTHRPTYANNRHDDRNDDDGRKGMSKNGTDEGDKSDKDNRPSGSGSRRGGGNRPDYDPYRSRDPYADRGYDRPYEDPYRERERRPLYDRYPDDPYAGSGRYDGYGGGASAGGGYRRPAYDDRYDRGYDRGSSGYRGNGYDRGSGYERGGVYDDGYGGYGPGDGRGLHDRPWDETYRGQAGWDAGGRGYYFASGRPDAAPAAAWGRPEQGSSGWQSVGYNGYRDPTDYRGPSGYAQDGYRTDGSYRQDGGYKQDGGYRQDGHVPSGWHSVNERRPYRDQSGVQQDNRDRPQTTDKYGQQNRYDQNQNNQNRPSYGQQNTGTESSSSTTPQTSYLYQRNDQQVTSKMVDGTTKSSLTS